MKDLEESYWRNVSFLLSQPSCVSNTCKQIIGKEVDKNLEIYYVFWSPHTCLTLIDADYWRLPVGREGHVQYNISHLQEQSDSRVV